ncbi:MAG: prolyl oligopeptidase family serine peptidase [Acidimicrobiia bacterium]|nr:prolyl oligopeptidase family serine peptidase [Acidimicrobiia bacterium]
MRIRPLAVAVTLVVAACSSPSDPSVDVASSAGSTSSPSTVTAPADDAVAAETTGEASTTVAENTCRPITAAENEPGQQAAIQIDLEAAGNTYPVRLYVPGDSPLAAAADGRYPLVLDWHGLGSDGFQQALLTNYEAVAEAEGFMVAHPTGGGGSDTADGGGVQAGWELTQFDVPGRDDLAMAETLIDRLVADYCADPDRVYSTGLSNGGFFTSRLVCDLADRIAAAVAVAGVTHPEGCVPSRPVPFMAFHGTADAIVPFEGGSSQLEGSAAPAELVEFFDQVMPDELAEFAADFACDPEPEAVAISDEVTAYDYQGCADDVPVRFVEIDGGGHTWPGAFLGAFMTEALGPTTNDVSATSDGWRFMSRFSLEGHDG